MYKLNCVTCGFIWKSISADVYECPMCESNDVVVLQQISEEDNE